MSAFSWRSDMIWLAADKVISSGTPSLGGRKIRQSAPIAENPKPDSPLISADAARIATSRAMVVGGKPANSNAHLKDLLAVRAWARTGGLPSRPGRRAAAGEGYGSARGEGFGAACRPDSDQSALTGALNRTFPVRRVGPSSAEVWDAPKKQMGPSLATRPHRPFLSEGDLRR